MSYINEQNLTEFDKNIKEYIDNKLLLDKERFAYGIEWDITVSDPHCTRIGNPELHRTLPLQSSMKGCLLADDGTVNEYLPEDDWSNSVLDGSKGQVMIELPDMYVKFESEGNKRRAWMSTMPLIGFHLWKKCYVSAYEAVLNRNTWQLYSACNTSPEFRGGRNRPSYDGTFRSELGKPLESVPIQDYRTYARNNRSKKWNNYLYQIHKRIVWLYYIEYANFNSQETFIENLDSNGFHQGGLGLGCTSIPEEFWIDFNDMSSILKCGETNRYGNFTKSILITLTNLENNSSLDIYTFRYRGIENVFGHLWKYLDDLLILSSENPLLYQCKNLEDINETNITKYQFLSNLPESQYTTISEIYLGNNGEIFPIKTGNFGINKYFCDIYIYEYNSIIKPLIGGNCFDSSFAGVLNWLVNYSSSSMGVAFGTRLCYIP